MTVVAFIFGAAAGSIVTWYSVDAKYRQLAEDEIDSVRDYYSSKLSKNKVDDIDETIEEEVENKDDNAEMNKISERQNYSGCFSKNAKDESEPEPDNRTVTSNDPFSLEPRPYVVSPDEYAEEYGYECRGITIYSGGVITDDDDNILDDVDNVIGLESLNYFGKYAENTVYVRNDRLKCDYEISKDDRTYEEVLNSKPYKRGVS